MLPEHTPYEARLIADELDRLAAYFNDQEARAWQGHEKHFYRRVCEYITTRATRIRQTNPDHGAPADSAHVRKTIHGYLTEQGWKPTRTYGTGTGDPRWSHPRAGQGWLTAGALEMQWLLERRGKLEPSANV